MKKGDNKQLTPADIALLQEYLTAIEELEKKESEELSIVDWDSVMDAIHKTGEIPEEYRDRVGVMEHTELFDIRQGKMCPLPEPIKSYYDIEYESRQDEYRKLERKYHDTLIKALKFTISQDHEEQSLIEKLQQIISDNKEELPSVIAHKIKNVDFPLDKLNRDIWSLLEYDTKGQLTFQRYNVAKKGSKKPVDILYSLDFTDLENVSITRKLEPYDKRVYLAVAARFNAGYDVMTVQQIYNDMGYTGRAGASDIRKINAALTKMRSAQLFIDNIAEAKSYKYDHFKYDGALLPMERIQAIINGQTAEAAIHLFREPPMVSFARERKQLTTIDIKLLDTPLNKTNANIALEDYLIEEIARIKKGNRSNKMLYETIYENTGIKTAKQKQRAPEKIRQLLSYYEACKFIKNYKEMKDGVAIEF